MGRDLDLTEIELRIAHGADCGDHDRYGFEEGAQLLDKILTEKGFHHEFALRPGNHGWSYLSQYMRYALLFHWRCFEQASTGQGRAISKPAVH